MLRAMLCATSLLNRRSCVQLLRYQIEVVVFNYFTIRQKFLKKTGNTETL